MTTTVAILEDYGLGSFNGKPIVGVGYGGECYHLRDHGASRIGVTFTEDFARNDCNWRPCKVCFPVAAGRVEP